MSATEQKLYDLINEHYHERKTPRENTTLSHMVVTIRESEDDVQLSTSVINPALPNEGLNVTPADAFRMTVADHCMLIADDAIGEALQGLIEQTTHMHQLCDALGHEAFIKILTESKSKEDFSTAIVKAMAAEKGASGLLSLLR